MSNLLPSFPPSEDTTRSFEPATARPYQMRDKAQTRSPPTAQQQSSEVTSQPNNLPHPQASRPPCHSTAPLTLGSGSSGSRLLPRLLGQGKDALPDLEPALVLGGGQASRVAEAAGEHLAQAGAQHLEHEHRLPVGQGEARAVAVEHEDARVKVGAHVAAEEGDGEGVSCRGFVGVIESALGG